MPTRPEILHQAKDGSYLCALFGMAESGGYVPTGFAVFSPGGRLLHHGESKESALQFIARLDATNA